MNIHGVVNLETFDAPFVEPTTVDGVSAAQLLIKIEARNPDKRVIHVIWDNAAYHKGPDVRAFLARTACRIHLIQLPPYCPHLKLGHDVRLIPPAYVKPFVKRQKNDAADAEAICEVSSRLRSNQTIRGIV